MRLVFTPKRVSEEGKWRDLYTEHQQQFYHSSRDRIGERAMDLSTNEKEVGSVDPTSRESSDTASDSGTNGGGGGGGLKICGDCQTTKTPLWRAGPSGPKSLCNACGIRFRRRREGEGEGEGEGLVVMEKLRKQRSPWGGFRKKKKKNWSRILGEEEQAALLLMALSTKPRTSRSSG